MKLCLIFELECVNLLEHIWRKISDRYIEARFGSCLLFVVQICFRVGWVDEEIAAHTKKVTVNILFF